MAAGKKRKAKQSHQPRKQQHRLSLDSVVPLKRRIRAPKHHRSGNKKISPALTSKIMKAALEQQKEILDEENREGHLNASFPDFSAPPLQQENGVNWDKIDAFDGFSDALSQCDGGEMEIDEEDEKILATFMAKETGPGLTMADIILQRIKEKDAEVAAAAKFRAKFDDKTINVFKEVGKALRQYTSGKIPNAFKHIPSITPWEEALYLTEPQNWSANAMYQATRIFASMKEKRVQIFYKNVLLPRVRDDIRKNKKLPPALYRSLKKALRRPAAFNKGILFPLCESGTCTVREAAIIGSVIKKVSIPFEHASAALVTLTRMGYCGTTSYFIKLLLDKKYSLPRGAVAAVVEHLMSFLGQQTIMPVIWHQSLLSLVQRYKDELQSKDKDNLHRLMQHQKHYLVTPEVKRELKSSLNRAERKIYAVSTSSVPVVNKPIEEDRSDVPDVPIEKD